MNTDILTPPVSEIFELNVTLLPPREKHPTIFRYFDELSAGEGFRILNDHDPKPLYYQLIGERGNIFSWNYLEKGPEWWRVEIRKHEADSTETIGAIAAADIRKAQVFKRYGIDFCCGGKKTLKQVCAEKGLNLEQVTAALETDEIVAGPALDYSKWDADFLVDYIYNQHHKYYYAEEPIITGLVDKVADHHGGPGNDLYKIRELYHTLRQELNTHFYKEEKVLFPFIKALVRAVNDGEAVIPEGQLSLTEPVQMMESDHEAAGELLEQLQQLTAHYTPPANACNSYQYLYKKLKELDEDLHQHIHLENNVLFPKALQLEKQLRP